MNYYEANKQKILAKYKEKRETDPQTFLDNAKRWRAKNPEYIKEYYQRNKEKIKKQNLENYYRLRPPPDKKTDETPAPVENNIDL